LNLTIHLGFVAHNDKSQLDPLQIFIFLGYQFLLHLGMVTPTQERWDKLQKILTIFLKATRLPARMWQRLLGLLAATERLVPQGLLHMRPLQLSLRNQWNQAWQSQDMLVTISQEIRSCLQWWLDPIHVMSGVPLVYPEPQIEVFTDASLFGWGAHVQQQTVSGVWTEAQSLLHINILEMEAVRLALLHFKQLLVNKVVLVATDNTTVVSYINRQGGTHSDSLYLLVEDILVWAQSCAIHLKARHIPGRLNVLADLLSRRHQVIPTEWMLHVGVFKMICSTWGTPHIDLFATYMNHQVPTYVSPMPDPRAYAVDALSMSWAGMSAYAFPPPALLSKVVGKIRFNQCQVILIAPWWPKQAWFPDLLHLSVDLPRRLPDRPDLLSQSQGHLLHPTYQIFHLHAWKLSGVLCEVEDFQRKLPFVSLNHKNNLLWQFMNPSGKSSYSGVVNDRLIHSIPLSHR
jgi:hypothetical protein